MSRTGSGYTEIGFVVKIRVPDSRDSRSVERDLATCLSFGSPTVIKLYECPAGRTETEVSVADGKL